jgi:hypothetical protein
MGDIGSFAVQSRELRQEGREWQTRKQAVQDAHDLADNGVGKGYMFGFLANIAHIGEYHDQFISDISEAFADGVATFDYMSAALDSAANAYDGVDSTAAESADHLRNRLPK